MQSSLLKKLKYRYHANDRLKNVVSTLSFLSTLQLFHHPCGMLPLHISTAAMQTTGKGSFNNIVFFYRDFILTFTSSQLLYSVEESLHLRVNVTFMRVK